MVWPCHNPLQIPSCYMFKQTFNRPNLRYTVLLTHSESVPRITREPGANEAKRLHKADCCRNQASGLVAVVEFTVFPLRMLPLLPLLLLLLLLPLLPLLLLLLLLFVIPCFAGGRTGRPCAA
jgi:hypothetical protein